MDFTCELCGATSSEVKPGGSISKYGKKMSFKVEDKDQIQRDLFKSDTAEITIEELGITHNGGTTYSTVEGLLGQMIDKLNCFSGGDNYNNSTLDDSGNEASGGIRRKFSDFLEKLEKCRSGENSFTLIIDDPLNNSYVSNPFYPEKDPNVVEEEYKRSEEQDDE